MITGHKGSKVGISVLVLAAALTAIANGVIGGLVWLADLMDRDDGDKLRWGFWHNPLMQFPPFHEGFLDLSMFILLACSAAAALGGLLLLFRLRSGTPLVTWQARVAIAVNSVVAFYIVGMMIVCVQFQHGEWHLGGSSIALALRLCSIAVDLTLWSFLSSKVVNEFFRSIAHPSERSFDVIIEAQPTSGGENENGSSS